MAVQSRTIAVTTHGRYLWRAPGGAPPWPWIVGFHGYGEAAAHQLAALQRTPGTERWLLVSIQALHRFYRRRSNEIVGSWMTRQDRELAIEDNVAYVRAVVGTLEAELGPPLRLVCAGFSQGVAMAWRAGLMGGFRCDGLVLAGGDVPPEIARGLSSEVPPVLLGRGDRDVQYPRAQFDADVRLLRKAGVALTVCAFDGGHDWTDAFAVAAGRFLDAMIPSP